MLNKLVRVGRDAELKHLANGTALMSFSAVYDVGFGQNKKTQWIDCTMFGDRAAKLVEYVLKGKQIVIYADDVCIQEWDKNDGTGKGFKLSCKIVSFDFVSDGGVANSSQSKPAAKPPAPQQPAPPSMDDFSDDIPF